VAPEALGEAFLFSPWGYFVIWRQNKCSKSWLEILQPVVKRFINIQICCYPHFLLKEGRKTTTGEYVCVCVGGVLSETHQSGLTHNPRRQPMSRVQHAALSLAQLSAQITKKQK